MVAEAVFSILTVPGSGHFIEVAGNPSVPIVFNVAEPDFSFLVLALLGKVNGGTSPIKTGPPSLSGSLSV